LLRYSNLLGASIDLCRTVRRARGAPPPPEKRTYQDCAAGRSWDSSCPSIRAQLVPAGADWHLVRSARAALMALHLSGVIFRRRWKPPRLRPWEGPFADPTQRLPQAPDVAAQRRAARRRWRVREAAKLVAARDDAAGDDIAA
jgi:hypothetical protein